MERRSRESSAVVDFGVVSFHLDLSAGKAT
jgi:hypothetical protein